MLTDSQVVNLRYLAEYLEVSDAVRFGIPTGGYRYMRIRTLTGWYMARSVVQALRLLLECHSERFEA